MVQALTCPNCGAALKIESLQPIIHCAYCGTTITLQAVPTAASESDPQLPDPSLHEVAALFRVGKRVQATIRYREITGAGLKEARQAIDRFAAGEALRRPNLINR